MGNGQRPRSPGFLLSSRAEAEDLHTGQAIRDALDARFSGQHISFGGLFFADPSGTSETDDRAAIDVGESRKLHQLNPVTFGDDDGGAVAAGAVRLMPPVSLFGGDVIVKDN